MIILARVVTVGALAAMSLAGRITSRISGARRRQLAEDHAREVGEQRYPATYEPVDIL